MADKKIKVKVDVQTNTEDSIAQLKALKRELKNAAAGSEEFKKIYNQIDDLEDKIKSAKAKSADWVDTLENAGGPLGALGGAINKVKVATQSWGAALKATGIGLIVSLLGGLVAAFSETEGSMKKFEPIIIAFEKTLGGILSALQPLIDGFVELAIKVMPYVTEAFKVAYSAITAVFQSLGKIGEAIGKLIKGDFSGAWESAKQSVTGFADNFEKAENRFEEGYKKTTKTQKKNLEEQKAAAEKALQEKLKRLEAEDKLDEAHLEKLKAQALQEISAREQVLKKEKEAALAKAKTQEEKNAIEKEYADKLILLVNDTEQQKLNVEMAFAKKAYDLKIKEIEQKQKLYKKDSAEYKTLQAEKEQAETEYIGKLTGFADQQKKISDEEIKSQKEFAEKSKAIRNAAIKDETDKALADRQAKYDKDLADLEADKEFIKKSESEKADLRKSLAVGLENDLTKIKTDARVKAMQDDLDLLSAQQKTLTEGTQAYLENSLAIENEAYAIKLANAKDNAKKIEAIETEHEQNIKDIKLKAFIAEKQIQSDRIAVIASIGSSISALAGKNKALAIAGIAIEKAAAIGQIWVSNSIANAKAVAASPLTFGMPWVAINTAAAVLSTAATIATGVKAVQEINSVQTPGESAPSVGVSGGSASAPPTAPTVSATSAPQVQTGQGINPSAQIAETISKAQAPIKAYVVSGEVSTQQALDRRTSRAATFSGG